MHKLWIWQIVCEFQNYALIAIGEGIIIVNDHTLLAKYEGMIKLGWKWCESVFEGMKWNVPLIEEVAKAVQGNKIPTQLIINIDLP